MTACSLALVYFDMWTPNVDVTLCTAANIDYLSKALDIFRSISVNVMVSTIAAQPSKSASEKGHGTSHPSRPEAVQEYAHYQTHCLVPDAASS